jgi:8-oxo-dGTP pyrophosphatase MutT (NUDIX family)
LSATSTDRGHRHEREFSAGAVAVRDGTDVAVIVPKKRSPSGGRVLGLPKGHADPGETMEQAATRELREEAGIVGALRESLGDVRYRYRRKGRHISKTVTFYLFDYVSGDIADHDHEIDESRWMPLREAEEALSFEGEREMIRRALSRLADDR